jgi:hypothetical protein
MHITLPKEVSLPDPRFGSKRTAHERLKAAMYRPPESILEAQARQTKYASGKEMF